MVIHKLFQYFLMRRFGGALTRDHQVAKEQPSWGIQALYNDRQLILNKRMTKYFIPFDSAIPDGSWRLFVFEEPNREQTIVLDEESTLLGRESFCNVVLHQQSVSRQHCVIQFRNVRLDPANPAPAVVPYVFDIGSKFGTFINDEKVPSCCYIELKPRDRVSIGLAVSAVLMRSTADPE
jgi:pSer/pThr/pTyr-binding forkhead associated (FHA) protein